MARARRIARAMHRGRSHLDYDTMESDAMMALAVCIDQWDLDPGLRERFRNDRTKYLNTAIKHRIIDGLRKTTGRNYTHPTEIPIETDLPIYMADEPGFADTESELKHMLAQLDIREREIVVRTIIQGATLVTAAQHMGLSETRAAKIRTRALEKLGPRFAEPRELSKRETEILALAADGLTNPEIALQLHLSAETVKTHTKSVLAKLGARSRAHAVAIAIRKNIIR